MASIMAASLMAPDYQPRLNNAPDASTPEDTVGPLPNIKLMIPKNAFQPPKHGLPINPSPHARAPSDPAIQVPPGIDLAETRQSLPLKQDSFSSYTEVQSFAVQAEPVLRNNLGKKSKSSTKEERSARKKQDKGTQTDEHLYRTSSDEDLACQYCHHCQRRLHHRSTTDSSMTYSNASSPGCPPSTERHTSPCKKRSSLNFSKFRMGVLSRTNTKETAKKTKESSHQEENRKSGSKKIDYEMVSPTEHWGAE